MYRMTVLFAVIAGTASAEPVAFVDTFDQSSLDARWRVGLERFEIRDGVLFGEELPEKHHGSVVRARVPFDDAQIEFRFRFVGSKQFNLVIDDMNCKEVHAGHICRVVVNQKLVRLTDDREGPMRNDIYAKRKAGASKKEMAQLTKGASVTHKVDLAANEWHTLRVTLADDIMTAQLNDGPTWSHQSPGFDHPTKTQFGFTVTGAGVEFDDVKFQSAD